MSLELLLGPMFAGKSSAILSIVNRHNAIGHKVLLLSHAIDTRYDTNQHIVNHDGSKIPCHKTTTLSPFLHHPEYAATQVIIIEEAQFFQDLYGFVLAAVDCDKKDVIVVGLDGDADRKPFGQILDLVPLSDRITKLHAFCTMCRDRTPALFTFCKKQKETQVCVGGSDLYEPLCRKHYLEMSGCALALIP